MQKGIIALLTAACVVLACALFRARQENTRLHDTTRTQATALDDATRQQVAATAANETLTAQVEALKTRVVTLQKSAPAATPESPPPASPVEAKSTEAKAPDFMGKLAEMMENPEMQDAMRAQQKTMLSMLYGALFKKLRLTPEQLDQLKEIQLNKQMAAMAMLGKGDKNAQRTAYLEATKQADLALKELLGDEQFATYQDYESTVGERMAIGQLNQQLSEKNIPLDDVQQEEFVTLMIEERAKLKIPTPAQQQAAWAGGMPSSEEFEKLLQQQADLNQRVYARSREILSEAQQAELKAFQDNQVQMQKLGLQMMKSMSGGDKK